MQKKIRFCLRKEIKLRIFFTERKEKQLIINALWKRRPPKARTLTVVTKLLLISYWKKAMNGNQVSQEVPSMRAGNFNLILMN